jgi:ppGpp synthetase/RelA/SpoT-type nucleotidyltranferase
MIESARTQWIIDRPRYAAFSKVIEQKLRNVVSGAGISAQVSSRPKEVHSLVKKLLAKPHLTYDTLPDKVGARIVVRYRSELRKVLGLVQETFAVASIEDTSERLSVDRVGYQGLHLDRMSLCTSDELVGAYPADDFFVELQLRTMSQHLWSEISHDTFYKNEDLLQKLPLDLRRRVHLMAGQVEVADREFERMNLELPSDPAVQLFKSLEPLYYMHTSERPNLELSLEVIHLLLPLYQADADVIAQRIIDRVRSSESLFTHIYSESENTRTEAAAFLFQPEAMMIYDCLLVDRDQTLKLWNEKFPSEELERVAVLFGISLQ